jgi:hypothetical protein
MNLVTLKQKLVKSISILLVVCQLSFGVGFLVKPKPAEAFWGIGDFTFNTTVADWYDVFKDIGLGVAERLAVNYTNKYLQRFVNKMLDKYRIKNFLNYEKVLSGYYLNQFIYEHVEDPDLRGIYNILATDLNSRAQIKTPDGKTMPAVAALKQKLDVYFYKRGGLSGYDFIQKSNESNYAYFSRMEAYYNNPPDFTEVNVKSEFEKYQNESAIASAREINASADGLKNDRSNPTGVVAHVCEGFVTTPKDFVNEVQDDAFNPEFRNDPRKTQTACVAHGGQWKIDGTGLAQSVIQNPAGFVNAFAQNTIRQIFENNLGIDNKSIYTAIGRLLGNFIFNKLNLDRSRTSSNGFDGTFNESGDAYSADLGNVPLARTLDRDNDNIPDGQDMDDDGQLISLIDTCYHGGVPPNCRNSSAVVSSPYFTPICQAIERATFVAGDLLKYMNEHADQLEGGDVLVGVIPVLPVPTAGTPPPYSQFPEFPQYGSSIDNYENKADADIWGRRVGELNAALDSISNTIESYRHSYFDNVEIAIGRYNSYLGEVTQSLMKDKDLDLARFGDGGGGLENLMRHVYNTYVYLYQLKVEIGKCDNPNMKAVNDVPPPPSPLDPGEDEEGSCQEPPDTIAPDFMGMAFAVRDEFPDIDLLNEETRGQFTAILAWRLHQTDSNWGRKNSGPGAPPSSDTLGYLRPDIGPGRFEAIDIINGTTGELQDGRCGVVPSTQNWLQPDPAP